MCLIGAGFFAQNHLQAWRDLVAEGAQVVGVCDLDQGRARTAAALVGAASFTDPTEMLDRLSPDVVDIATTSPSHRPLVELCAPRVPLVICQKPLADTLDDARAMVAACNAGGATFLVHENTRWQRGFVRMRELVAAGAVGTPRHLHVRVRHRHDIYGGQPYLATTPRLAIMDVGVHLFDLVRLFMGEATAIACEMRRRNPAVAGEDAFTALSAHQGGIAITDVSFHSRLSPDPFPQTLATLEGDDGTLELAQGFRLVIHGANGRREEDVEPAVPAWGEKPWHLVQNSVLAFQRHVLQVWRGEAAPQPSGADNLRTLALSLAAYEASGTGRRVEPEAA